MKPWALILLLAVAPSLGIGCRTGANVDPFVKARTTVVDSVGKGAKLSATTGPVNLPVRFNPSTCECPDFEIYAFGRWTRTFIEGGASATVLERLRASGDSLSEAKLRGKIVDEIRLAENRVRYPVFVAQ